MAGCPAPGSSGSTTGLRACGGRCWLVVLVAGPATKEPPAARGPAVAWPGLLPGAAGHGPRLAGPDYRPGGATVATEAGLGPPRPASVCHGAGLPAPQPPAAASGMPRRSVWPPR